MTSAPALTPTIGCNMAEAEKSNITQFRHTTPQELATARLQAWQLARQMGLAGTASPIPGGNS
jgi:hypothetical protein